MLSKVNSFGLITVMAIVLLLFVCFASSVVYADGAGGQIPDPPPEDIDGAGGQIPDPPPEDIGAPGDPGGISFTDVLGILLSFII